MEAYFAELEGHEFCFSRDAVEQFWSVCNPEVTKQFDIYTDDQLYSLCDSYGDSYVAENREDAIVFLMWIIEDYLTLDMVA